MKLLITLIYIILENLPCYEPFYRLERNQQHSDHGDVCRHTKSRGYYCPVGCFKPKHGSLPFCQTSKTNKSPCRVESGIFRNVPLYLHQNYITLILITFDYNDISFIIQQH